MNDRHLIIAGNHRQADQWLRDEGVNPRDYWIITSEHQLMGFRGISYHLVGEWWLNPVCNGDYFRAVFEPSNVLLSP